MSKMKKSAAIIIGSALTCLAVSASALVVTNSSTSRDTIEISSNAKGIVGAVIGDTVLQPGESLKKESLPILGTITWDKIWRISGAFDLIVADQTTGASVKVHVSPDASDKTVGVIQPSGEGDYTSFSATVNNESLIDAATHETHTVTASDPVVVNIVAGS